MKLFLWEAPDCLNDYTNGVAFALADTLDQALDLVTVHAMTGGGASPVDARIMREFRETFAKYPVKVIDYPFGFTLIGGG